MSPKPKSSVFPQLGTQKSKWKRFGEHLGIFHPLKKSWGSLGKKNCPLKITVLSVSDGSSVCDTKTNFAVEKKRASIINCWCCNTHIIMPYSIITATQASVDTGWAIAAVSHLNNVGDSGGISDNGEGLYNPFSSRSYRKKEKKISIGGVQAATAVLDRALTEYCHERNEVHGCLITLPDIMGVSLQGACLS